MVESLLKLFGGYVMVTSIFVALRVAGAISWAWLWVLSPLWLPFTLLGIAFGSFLVVKRTTSGQFASAIPRANDL